MKTLTKAFVCLLLLAGVIGQTRAALITQGTLQAVFDPTGQPLGYVTSNGIPDGAGAAMSGVWQVTPTNSGRITNGIIIFSPSVIQEPGGATAVLFDGSATNSFTLFTAGQSNNAGSGTNIWAASTLVGVNPTLSIEAWVMAPVLGAYSTIASWGATTTSSNQMTFGYGASDGNVGGALNMGANTFNWGAGGPPAAGVYHHLVVTHNGTNTVLYCDGVAVNSSFNLQGGTSFAPATNFGINIGSTRASTANALPAMESGTISTGASAATGHARMHIAKVRIMDGELSASDVANNYATDKAVYQFAPSTLAHAPTHRYTFNNGAGQITSTAVVTDVGTLANANATVYSAGNGITGMAQFTGSKLHMEGGSPTNGAFVDLPTNLISSLSAIATNNGLTVGSPGYNSTAGTGTGQVTVEGWLTVRGHPNFWQTYFAFGDTTATNGPNAQFGITTNVISGKIIGLAMVGQAGPGGLSTASNNIGQLTNVNGGYGGINMWLFQQNNNEPTSTKMDLNGNGDTFYGGYSNSVATGGTPVNDNNWYGYAQNQNYPFTMTHYACTWDDASGYIITYINGVPVSRNHTDKRFYMIYDRNCWLGRDFNNSNPTLEGDYDEFRIYSNVLTAAEVLGNYEAGPNVVNTSALGNATALHIVRTTSSSNWVGSVAYFTVQADYAGPSGVDVLPDAVTFSVDDPTVIALTPGMMKFLKPGTTTVHATLAGSPARTDNLTITVVPLAATMTHRYSFNQSDSDTLPFDSVSTIDYGNGPGYPPGLYGYVGATPPNSDIGNKVLITNGIGLNQQGWIDLGPNLISPTYDALTVELWASFGSPGGTAPLFSFGDQRINPSGIILSNLNVNGAPNGALPERGRYFIEAYSRPNVQLVWSADDPGIGNSGVNFGVTRTGALDNQTNVHVVAEYHPTGGFARVYVNGVPTTQTNTYLPLMSALVDNYNYIGVGVNSGYAATPGQPSVPQTSTLAGTENTNNMLLDEFRIYNGILAQSNVVIDLATGPNLIVSNPGTLNSVTLVTPSTILVQQALQTTLSATFANVTNVNLFLYDTNSSISSSDTTKLTVNTTGTITGVSAGTAYEIASYPGFPTVSNLVTVQTITPVLTHEWSFATNTPATGATNNPVTLTWDTVAGSLNATNFNGAFETNGQLVLASNTFDFLQLPTGVIDSSYVVLTIEFWAGYTNGPATNAANVDVYGFGDVNSGTGFGRYYLSFSPHTGTAQVSSKINPNDPATAGAGETAAASAANRSFDGKTNVQVVATFHPFGGFMQLFTNGVLSATNTLATGVPTALQQLNDQVSYIGKPLYVTNQFLNATIDEFRIYKGLMSPLQVLVDAATGPNAILNLNGSNILVGGVTNVTLTVTPNMITDQSQVAVVSGAFTNAVNPAVNPFQINAYQFQAAAGGSFPTLVSGNSNVITIVNSNITAIGIGSTTVTATWSNKTSAAVTITVTAPPGSVAMTHRWPFSDANGSPTVADVVGGANGTVVGAGVSLNGAGQMTIPTGFTGQSNYVQLPVTNLLSSLSNATIEFWIQGLDISVWARVFDFGEFNTASNNIAIGQQIGSGLDYFMFTGNASGSGASGRYKPLSATYANDVNLVGAAGVATTMPTNFQMYYAIVYNAAAGVASMYTNGVLLNRGAVVDSLTNFNEISNYFGKSHYTADNNAAAIGAVYDEFRIWTNAKTGSEIAAQFAAGPNKFGGAPVSISNSPAGGGMFRLTWPVWGPRYGTLFSSPSLDTPVWTSIGGSPTLATNATAVANTAVIVNWQDITPGAGNKFYRIQ